MTKEALRDEYTFEGNEAFHVPTGMPMMLLYPDQEGPYRSIRWFERDMKGYNEHEVVQLGLTLLVEHGY